MKFLVAFAVLIAIAAAASVDVPILKSEFHNDGEKFQYQYETGDGTAVEANGDIAAIRGSFKFVSPEGTPFEVTYIADENGFQPTGAHIPQVPEQIARALEYIRAHPPKE